MNKLILISLLALASCAATATDDTPVPSALNYQDKMEMGGATLYKIHDDKLGRTIYMCVMDINGAACSVTVTTP